MTATAPRPTATGGGPDAGPDRQEAATNRDLPPGRRRLVLLSMCFSLALVVAGNSSLNVALPEIGRDLTATQTDLLWVVNLFALTFAALLLPAGALADRLGRKEVLVGGLVVLTVFSALSAFATDPPQLIAARGLAGIGAAAVMPGTLSIITSTFPESERGRAVGIWAGTAGAGGMIGILASGAVLEVASWQAVFAATAFAGTGAIVAVVLTTPTSKDPDAVVDVPGAVLSASGLAGLVYALIEGPEVGWTDPLVLAGFAAAAVLLPAFVVVELRRRHPLLDVRLFRHRGFGTGSLAIAVQFGAALAFFLFVVLYLQYVRSYSPLESGLALLPMGLGLALVAPQAPAISDRLGFRLVVPVGLVLMAAAFVAFGLLPLDVSYWALFAALVVFGLGFGLSTAPSTTALTEAMPAEKQGVASAVNDTSREVGAAVGLALLGSVLTTVYVDEVSPATEGLPPGARDAAEAGIGPATGVAQQLGQQGQGLLDAAQTAFGEGYQAALLAGSAALLVGAALVAALGPRRSRADDGAAEAPDDGRDDDALDGLDGRSVTASDGRRVATVRRVTIDR